MKALDLRPRAQVIWNANAFLITSNAQADMIESVITAKSQTTLPSGVRKALGVQPGDRLVYIVEKDRAIIMKARDAEPSPDPVVDAFLDFLARDMASHPERLTGLTPDLIAHIQRLTEGIEIDLDAPIEGDVGI
jgi:antitoxin PrlF